jgi:lipooligosaccharide transport system permease protein
MNGAMSDGFFNIYFKLHVKKTYDGILATPMRVPDVAFGEMLWAISRGSMYAASFLVTVVVVGAATDTPMLLSGTGVFALPGAVLVAASFSALALCMSSFVRKIDDFDAAMGLFVMPMFLFSGTFFPVSRLPPAGRWIVEALPLHHGVSLLRQLTTGRIDATLAVHVTYLCVLAVVAFAVAAWRLERALIK